MKHLKNCHVFGVDSVILGESPAGGLIRAFIAHENHSLWWYEGQVSVGFHPHRRDITIHVVEGDITNLTFSTNGIYSYELSEYRYKSKILGETGMFDLVKSKDIFYADKEYMLSGSSRYLPAETIHTVVVKRGERATWVIVEGKENPNYEPRLFTNRNPNTDNDQLYTEMSEEESSREIRRIKAIWKV